LHCAKQRTRVNQPKGATGEQGRTKADKIRLNYYNQRRSLEEIGFWYIGCRKSSLKMFANRVVGKNLPHGQQNVLNLKFARKCCMGWKGFYVYVPFRTSTLIPVLWTPLCTSQHQPPKLEPPFRTGQLA
jgi:hypothetical protein